MGSLVEVGVCATGIALACAWYRHLERRGRDDWRRLPAQPHILPRGPYRSAMLARNGERAPALVRVAAAGLLVTASFAPVFLWRALVRAAAGDVSGSGAALAFSCSTILVAACAPGLLVPARGDPQYAREIGLVSFVLNGAILAGLLLANGPSRGAFSIGVALAFMVQGGLVAWLAPLGPKLERRPPASHDALPACAIGVSMFGICLMAVAPILP